MIFNIITIFPQMFEPVFSCGVISKSIENGLIKVNPINLRDFTTDKHKITEDYPYGGGPGLVMKVEPVFRAVEHLKSNFDTKVVLLDPRGRKFNDDIAKKYVQFDNVTLICGRYEGIDERVRDIAIDEEISIGDYILTGGEFAAMVFIDSVSRYVKGVLGDDDSNKIESFAMGGLEFPHYTRPAIYKALKVPDILLSGDHKKIEEWRIAESIKTTLHTRKDLLKRISLNANYKKMMDKMQVVEKITKNLSIALLHYPMIDKSGDTVATSITNMDLHDISRTCMTYDINKYYIITPLEAQQEIAKRVMRHWLEGYGSYYNNNRSQAFTKLSINKNLAEVVEELEIHYGKKPLLIATTARWREKTIDYDNIFDMLQDANVLLLFGTGWGFTSEFLDNANYILEPIKGTGSFNHLSVRSAVAIVLDRIFRYL
jgi:tRNA (guanine37-N1)-methyltransferase